MRRALELILAWFGFVFFTMWLVFRLWRVQGRLWLLPRALGPLDWLFVLLAAGLAGFSLYRSWRGRTAGKGITGPTLQTLVRFWHNWRKDQVPENSFRHDELDWTIRVTGPAGPVPGRDAPAFAIDPVPRCPNCGLPAGEKPASRAWLRSCVSDACNWRQLSRDSLAETAAALARAAREAWLVSGDGASGPGPY